MNGNLGAIVKYKWLLIMSVCFASVLILGFAKLDTHTGNDRQASAGATQTMQPAAFMINTDKIMKAMFPEENFEKKGRWYLTKTGGGQSYRIESIIPGTFIDKGRNELLAVVYRPGTAHAEGFYHLYMAVFDNERGSMLSETAHFFADHGSYKIFQSRDKDYVFFAGSVTYNGLTEWDGGLWEAGAPWKKKWPETDEYWQNKAIEFDQYGLRVRKRKLLPKKDDGGVIPDYVWDYAYSLSWNEDEAVFGSYIDDHEHAKQAGADGTIELRFAPIPVEALKECKPEEDWILAKSIKCDIINGKKEAALQLYIDSASGKPAESADVMACIQDSGVFWLVGDVSSFGLKEISAEIADKTYDGTKEIVITGPLGSTYIEQKIISYDFEKGKWLNILRMGTPQATDLKSGGKEVLVAASAGSIPTYVEMYQWDGQGFGRANIAEQTGCDYAVVFSRTVGDREKWLIETGRLQQGVVKEKQHYRFEEGQLIEEQLTAGVE